MTPGGRAPASRDRDAIAGSLAAIVAASLFGMLGPLTRLAGEAGLPGIAMTAWRAALGVAFVAALIAVRGIGPQSLLALRSLDRHGRATLATAALAGFALNAAMFSAFSLVPVALALMMFYTYPAGVVVVDVLLGRERLTRWRAAALVLSMSGVVLVLAGGATAVGGVPINPAGIALGLFASASQVLFVTVSRSGYRSVPAPAASLVIMSTAIVGAVCVALVAGLGPGLLVPFTNPSVWPYILLAGIAAAGVSSLLFLIAIRRIGGTRTGILMLFEPVTGVVLAALLLGESMTLAQVAGAALVLSGALVLQLGARPALEPVAETAAGPMV